MKKFILLLVFLVAVSTVGWGQVAAWDFSGQSSPATFAATTFNANLISTSGASNITRGSGAAASSASNCFRTTGFQNNGISVANTDYFQITLTAATGYKTSLSTIDAKFGGTTSFFASPGVTSQFAYSLDGSTFTLIGSSVQSTSLTMTQIDLTGISALQNVNAGTTITIRYFASGQTTTGGWGFLSAATAGTNGLAIGGTVAPLTSAPTVTTQAVNPIGTTAATGNGTITATGGVNPITRGVCWVLYSNGTDPTTNDFKAEETGGSFSTGAFSESMTTNLSTETRYKLKAYATNSVGTGYGSLVNFWTLSTEPPAHTTTFTSSVISQTEIDLSFDAASLITNADGYIILQKTGSLPSGLPTDGAGYTVGGVIGDATVAAIVTNSAAVSAQITGLTAGTHYYFTIMPYNWNLTDAATYNYKTDGTVPSTNATTTAPLDATSSVSGPALGSQPNPVLLSSLVTSSGAAVRVFDMDIYDYGTTDAQQTKVTQVTIKTGTNNTANWLTTIQGVKLSIDAGSSFVTTGTPTIGASSIVIPITSGNLNVPNNNSLVVSLYVYLNPSGLTDNQKLEFKVDAAASSNGFTADPTGSTFLATFPSAPVSNQILIDVVGTKLNFSTQPFNTTVNTDFSAAVEATDANGNRDLDATTSITLSSSIGTLSSTTGLTKNLASGLFSWADLQNNTAGTGVTISASGGTLTSATSSSFRILSAQPTVQASAILFSNVGMTSMTVSWTNGDGAYRIVVGKAAGTPGTPTDGVTYIANPIFGSGGTFGASEYVIYNGTGCTVDVTGLTGSTSYTFKVFEFNGSSGTENYIPTSNATSQTTTGLTYYSNGSGDPAVTTNWKSNRDGTGSSPANFTTGEAFVIENGDNMSTTTTWSISGTNSKLQIESGGTLTASNAVTLAAAATFQIDNGGTYIHNNTGTPSSTIFGGTESFGATSNFKINSWINNTTAITTGVTLPFGNLEINWTGNTLNWQQAISGTLTLTAGSLTITSVGSGSFRFSATGAPTITINKSYSQASGTVNLASTSGTTTINVTENFSVSGGTFTSTSASSKVVFNGSITQNFTNSGTISIVNFEVGATSTLNMGTQLMTGGNFTLPSGATLFTANAGGIDGSITVSGTKSLSTGTNFTFNGSSAQVMGALLPVTVNNLTIDNSAGVTLSNTALTVNGNLVINNGKLLTIETGKQVTASGTLTNSAGTSGLVIKSGGSLIHSTASVPATVELTTAQNLWHYITPPVSDATANVFLGDYLATFDTATNTWSSNLPDPTTPLTVMQGYGLNVKANPTLNTFTGNLNSGTLTYSCAADATNGYTLTGNPYPSAIDLSLADVTWPNNAEKTAWFWDAAANNYKAYPSSGSLGTHTQYAPAMQAFFVRNTVATANFGLTNAARVHNAETLLKEVAAIENVIVVKAASEMNTFNDEALICFMPGTTTGYNPSFDATKMAGGNTAPQLYTLLPGDVAVTVNAQPFINKVTVVPMGFSCTKNGTYTFTASKLESFKSAIGIVLEDLKEAKTQDLRANPVYAFTHDTVNDANRFVLHFTNPTIGIGETNTSGTINIYSFGQSVYVTGPDKTATDGDLVVYDLVGRRVYHSRWTATKFNPGLCPGYYVVKVVSEKETAVGKVYLH